MKSLVELPQGEVEAEWIAFNIHEILEFTVAFAKVINSFCSCTQMTAGPRFEYQWTDETDSKSIPAKEYIQNVIDFSYQQLQNQQIFPIAPGSPFPQNFKSRASQIIRRILRIYIHAFINHQSECNKLGIEQKVEDILKLILTFGKEFNLLKKGDIEPIKPFAELWGCWQ